MRRLRILFGFVILGVAFASVGFADTHITMREGTTVDPSAELPEGYRQSMGDGQVKEVTLWMGRDRWARLEPDGGGLITRLDRGRWYALDGKTNTYRGYAITKEDAMSSAQVEMKRTGETRQFGSWQAERYDLTVHMGAGPPMAVTLWMSTDVGVDLSTYHAYLQSMAAHKGGDWMKELLEIPGYPVRQEVRFGPVNSWQELVEIEDEPAPNGVYEPPSGYKEVK